MSQNTDELKFAERLGSIKANLLSLEFLLRVFLFNSEGKVSGGSCRPISLHSLEAGQLAPVNALTNYDSLGQLIDKFNHFVKQNSAEELCINKAQLVDLRDALAHGRAFTDRPAPPFRLLKFAKPRGEKVEVTFSALMTKEWFVNQAGYILQAMKSVQEAGNRLEISNTEIEWVS